MASGETFTAQFKLLSNTSWTNYSVIHTHISIFPYLILNKNGGVRNCTFAPLR